MTKCCATCPNAQDAERYRLLRSMVGPLNIILGDTLLTGHERVREPSEIRADLDANLDQRIDRQD